MITTLFVSAGLLLGMPLQDGQQAEAAVIVQEEAGPQEKAGPREERGPRITLLEAGEEPRRELRYTFTEGDQFVAEFVQTMGMASDNGMMPEMSFPPIRQTLEITVTDVDEETARYEAVWGEVKIDEDPEAMPGMLDMIRDEMEGMEGMRGWYRVDNRGRVLESGMDLPPDVSPMIAGMMEQMEESLSDLSAMFPAEAIGVGARWAVESTSDMMNIAMSQRAVLVLESLENDEARISMTVDGIIGKGPPRGDAAEGGFDVERMEGAAPPPPPAREQANEEAPDPAEMIRGTTKGTGTMLIALDTPMPRESVTDVEMDQEITVDMFGEVSVMRQRMTMKIEITTRRAD